MTNITRNDLPGNDGGRGDGTQRFDSITLGTSFFRGGVLTNRDGDWDVVSADFGGAGGRMRLFVKDMGRSTKPRNGDMTLVDDDKLKDGQQVPMPNRETLQPALKYAYVLPMFDVGDNNDNTRFVVNVRGLLDAQFQVSGDSTTDNWTSRALNANDFWVVYVLGAFQSEVENDNDYDREGVHAAFTSGHGGSLIFIEATRGYANQKGWDTAIATLNGHKHWVLSVAFSPDGSSLASAGYDGTVRVLNRSQPPQKPSLER